MLTVVVNHALDIAKNLAVSSMGFFSGLGAADDALPLKDTLGLRVENEGDGKKTLDPFCDVLARPYLLRGSNCMLVVFCAPGTTTWSDKGGLAVKASSSLHREARILGHSSSKGNTRWAKRLANKLISSVSLEGVWITN